jgi:hypothetical protein
MGGLLKLPDKGYFSRIDIKASHDLGMTVNVPQIDTSGSAKKGIFNKSLFKYDKVHINISLDRRIPPMKIR